MRGLMQDSALTVDKILDHAKNWHGEAEVVSRSVEGPIVRTTYAEIHSRAKQVSNLLLGLGVTLGDRVATLAWNTARHMEAWYGIMGIGAICHTLNPRLHPEQIAWIINHAEDKIIFVDLTFVPILEAILANCPSVEQVVIMTDADHMPGFKVQGVPAMKFGGAHCYETAVGAQSAECRWGGFDENTACGLCYTSGTTGDPKGVLYSHRSNYLHVLVGLQADVLGISGVDSVLPVVPMFHANAWGTAFACPAVGAKMVMPGPKMDGASIHELLESEKVTFSAAVPTVWQMLLGHLDSASLSLPHLKRVVIGGSACPEAIIRGFKERYDVDVLHAWGMTETSPLGTLGSPNARIASLSYDEQMPYKLKQGRPPLGIEMKLTDDEGRQLPHDGETFGHLKVRGPFVVGQYFKGAGGNILDADSFFDTGDVATIDREGFMQITDRAKDVIKSGGEWISSIDIENIAMGHPKAENAAVIGVLHPKWDERPLLLVKLKPGVEASKEEFIEFLQGKIAKWWMPDDVLFVEDIPLGATGKIDKKLLRARFADYRLPEVPLPVAMAAAAPVALRAAPSPVLLAPEPPGVVEEPVLEAPSLEPVAPGEAVQAGAVQTPPDPEPDPEPGQSLAPETRDPFEVARVSRVLDDQPQPETPDAGPETPDAAPAAPLAEALIAGAAAAAAAGVFRADDQAEPPTMFAVLDRSPEPVAPVEPASDNVGAAAEAPPETVAAADKDPVATERPVVTPDAAAPAPLPEDVPLSWGQGVAEPPRSEHVINPEPGTPEIVMTSRKGDDDVPPPLSGMPELTPLNASELASTGVGAAAATLVTTSAEPASLTFPSSLKAGAETPLSAPAGEAPLSFSPVPYSGKRSKIKAGGPAQSGAKGGLADVYLALGLLMALAPALVILAGAVGMRMGAWDWRTGFAAVMVNGPAPNLGWAPALLLLSILTGVIGLLVAAFGGWKRLWKKALLNLGVTAATIGALGAMIGMAAQAPRIHDVATDWSVPMLFSPKVMADRGPDANIVEPSPVMPLDGGGFAGRRISEINAETCPAARPVILSTDTATAYQTAKAALLKSGLTLVTDEPANGRLEAYAASLIYGFKDDVVVRVRRQGGGSRIDMRSVSRVGLGDLGANCKRIGKLSVAMVP
ncbi:MAG: long-chain-fatty-acid--CoA ligase [Caulobacter sp.]|nr:long-chain-fatty-acid--CoA ligase [Caulobacter sp.]